MKMDVTVRIRPVQMLPNPARVTTQLAVQDPEITKRIVGWVVNASDAEITAETSRALSFLSKHYPDPDTELKHRFDQIKSLFGLDIQQRALSRERQLLLAAYHMQEVSTEAVSFLNPCVIDHPDQSHLSAGQKRIVVSFETIGFGAVSSLVFRSVIIDVDGAVRIDSPREYVASPSTIKRYVYNRKEFAASLNKAKASGHIVARVMNRLGSSFIYGELVAAVEEVIRSAELSKSDRRVAESILWGADSHYEIEFGEDSDISERVIRPVSYAETQGIQDARFCKFEDADDLPVYYAPYAAFNGYQVTPKLFETHDFRRFTVRPLYFLEGFGTELSLFPRRQNGKYIAICQTGQYSIGVAFSDNLVLWREIQTIQTPEHAWEMACLGNCGSPVEMPFGWLVLTYGKGPIGLYGLGAALLAKDDPTRVLSRLAKPIVVSEMEGGYIPNRVSSAGSVIHNDELIIPYSASGVVCKFASIRVDELLSALLNDPKSYAVHRVYDAKVFVSYCHRDSDIVSAIDNELMGYGIELVRDIRDAEYAASFREFMKRIRETDYVLMIISDSFLKSRNCMFEVLEVVKDENYRERLLPILIGNLDLSNVAKVTKYITFWKSEYEKVTSAIVNLEGEERAFADEELKVLRDIRGSIGAFIRFISDLKYTTPETLRSNGYRDILRAIGLVN